MAELQTIILSGILKFPRFTSPMKFDSNQNKFVIDEEEGEFGCVIEIPSINAKDSIKKIMDYSKLEKELLIQSKKYDPNLTINDSNYPFADTLDTDKKTTGSYDFKLKRKAVNKKGQKAYIPYIDAKKNLIPREELELITNGSKVNIKGCLYSWDKITQDSRTKEKWVDKGVSICLLAVQVVEAVKKGGDIDCFDVINDGYDSNNNDIIGNDEIVFN